LHCDAEQPKTYSPEVTVFVEFIYGTVNRGAHLKGHISQIPHYNSIFNYFENETLTPYLEMLIEESSLPLASVEKDFAVDSSVFSTSRFVQWV
jgi:hypothetical protein